MSYQCSTGETMSWLFGFLYSHIDVIFSQTLREEYLAMQSTQLTLPSANQPPRVPQAKVCTGLYTCVHACALTHCVHACVLTHCVHACESIHHHPFVFFIPAFYLCIPYLYSLFLIFFPRSSRSSRSLHQQPQPPSQHNSTTLTARSRPSRSSTHMHAHRTT